MAAPPAPPTRAPVKTEPPLIAPTAAPPAAPTAPPVTARSLRFVSEHPARKNPVSIIQANLCAIDAFFNHAAHVNGFAKAEDGTIIYLYRFRNKLLVRPTAG